MIIINAYLSESVAHIYLIYQSYFYIVNIKLFVLPDTLVKLKQLSNLITSMIIAIAITLH